MAKVPAKKKETPKKALKKAPLKAVVVAKPAKTPAVTAAKPAASKPAVQKPAAPKKSGTYFYAYGKRKTATASVRMYTNGKGVLTINDRTFENYFPLFVDQDRVLSPLRVTNTQKQFDITIKVFGGGVHAQAEAARHGIAKALLEYQADLRSTLKPFGYLTRDSRVKERKKYGLKRARRAPQWQKR
ncbi:30S ribosomal protein S9 [Candidatus Peregrinibacteria bacterium]|nr:30S ribosomal protein S9 [Candidatus Peregrinibacteria bacterium]